MTVELLFGIMTNVLVLASLALVYSLVPEETVKNSLLRKMVIGVFLSVVGFAIMNIPFELSDGVFFDTRSILISASGMFLGFIPTLIAAVFLVGYRLLLGGAGMYVGSLVVLVSAGLGLLWRHFRLKKITVKDIKTLELYFVGVIVHIIMLLTMLLLPKEVRMTVIEGIWVAVLFVYPLGSYIIYSFFLYQRHIYFQQIKTIQSETQYRSLFEKSKAILLLIHIETGAIADANQSAVEFYGWSLDILKKMRIQDINTLTEEEIQKEMDLCKKENKTYFHFRHQTLNKGIIDVEVYSGPITLKGEEYFLSTIIDITEKKQRELMLNQQQEKLRYVSHHDYLTGLYNRYFFEEELSRLNTKRQLPLSIIMGDVNGLKLINDTFSHLEGDELLKEIANIFKKSVREEDIVARWGGDEFVILLPQTTKEVAERICDTIHRNCKESSYTTLTPNIGLGYYTKENMDENVYETIKKAEEGMYRNKLLQGKSMRNGLILSLESTLIERSHETKEHAENMINLSKAFGKICQLSEDEINKLTLIARLHDIGKIAVADNILNKKGALTSVEWEEMKEHAIAGGRIVSSIPELLHIANEIIHHHEWYDGSGYPNGLKKDAIPKLSRMISIVDAYEAITSNRVYRKKRSHEEAIQELLDSRGTQFDPELVDLFIESLK